MTKCKENRSKDELDKYESDSTSRSPSPFKRPLRTLDPSNRSSTPETTGRVYPRPSSIITRPPSPDRTAPFGGCRPSVTTQGDFVRDFRGGRARSLSPRHEPYMREAVQNFRLASKAHNKFMSGELTIDEEYELIHSEGVDESVRSSTRTSSFRSNAYENRSTSSRQSAWSSFGSDFEGAEHLKDFLKTVDHNIEQIQLETLPSSFHRTRASSLYMSDDEMTQNIGGLVKELEAKLEDFSNFSPLTQKKPGPFFTFPYGNSGEVFLSDEEDLDVAVDSIRKEMESAKHLMVRRKRCRPPPHSSRSKEAAAESPRSPSGSRGLIRCGTPPHMQTLYILEGSDSKTESGSADDDQSLTQLEPFSSRNHSRHNSVSTDDQSFTELDLGNLELNSPSSSEAEEQPEKSQKHIHESALDYDAKSQKLRNGSVVSQDSDAVSIDDAISRSIKSKIKKTMSTGKDSLPKEVDPLTKTHKAYWQLSYSSGSELDKTKHEKNKPGTTKLGSSENGGEPIRLSGLFSSALSPGANAGMDDFSPTRSRAVSQELFNSFACKRWCSTPPVFQPSPKHGGGPALEKRNSSHSTNIRSPRHFSRLRGSRVWGPTATRTPNYSDNSGASSRDRSPSTRPRIMGQSPDFQEYTVASMITDDHLIAKFYGLQRIEAELVNPVGTYMMESLLRPDKPHLLICDVLEEACLAHGLTVLERNGGRLLARFSTQMAEGKQWDYADMQLVLDRIKCHRTLVIRFLLSQAPLSNSERAVTSDLEAKALLAESGFLTTSFPPSVSNSLSPKEKATLAQHWRQKTPSKSFLFSIRSVLVQQRLVYSCLSGPPKHKVPVSLDQHFTSQIQDMCRDEMLQSLRRFGDEMEAHAMEEELSNCNLVMLMKNMFEQFKIEMPDVPIRHPVTSYPLVMLPPKRANVPMPVSGEEWSCTPVGSWGQAIFPMGKFESEGERVMAAVNNIWEACVEKSDYEMSARVERKNLQIIDRLAKLKKYQNSLLDKMEQNPDVSKSREAKLARKCLKASSLPIQNPVYFCACFANKRPSLLVLTRNHMVFTSKIPGFPRWMKCMNYEQVKSILPKHASLSGNAYVVEIKSNEAITITPSCDGKQLKSLVDIIKSLSREPPDALQYSAPRTVHNLQTT